MVEMMLEVGEGTSSEFVKENWNVNIVLGQSESIFFTCDFVQVSYKLQVYTSLVRWLGKMILELIKPNTAIMIRIFLVSIVLLQMTFRSVGNSSSYSSGDILEIFLFEDYQ